MIKRCNESQLDFSAIFGIFFEIPGYHLIDKKQQVSDASKIELVALLPTSGEAGDATSLIQSDAPETFSEPSLGRKSANIHPWMFL